MEKCRQCGAEIGDESGFVCVELEKPMVLGGSFYCDNDTVFYYEMCPECARGIIGPLSEFLKSRETQSA